MEAIFQARGVGAVSSPLLCDGLQTVGSHPTTTEHAGAKLRRNRDQNRFLEPHPWEVRQRNPELI